MNLALDYDETYTLDPILWDAFILAARSRDHKVYIVTNRDEYNYRKVAEVMFHVRNKVDGVFFTSDTAKLPFMSYQGILIDVWVDDSPQWILSNKE